MPPTPPPASPPTTASLKAWWKHFTITQKWKSKQASSSSPGAVFGVPLRQSLRYASVQIFTANQNNVLYVWGYIPVVVAKCGLFLKENGTEVEGIFRISGSTRRMRELQTIFETPPRYGKNIAWKELPYTPHDVASIFRRFLTLMPEPIIPHSLYHDFRNVYSKKPFNQEEAIGAYKRLIGQLPLANQYLLLYVLDLLTVFDKKSEKNMMPAANLAVIFRPAVLNHPAHEMSHEHHKLSQEVLEFLIKHQDWFMLDIPPPPRSDSLINPPPEKAKSRNPFSSASRLDSGKPGTAPQLQSQSQHTKPDPNSSAAAAAITDELNMYVGPVSDEEEDGGWRLAGSVTGTTVGRRRTFSERGSPRPAITDEHAKTMADGRRSAENVNQSSSAPNTVSALKAAVQLPPVREASSGDLDGLTVEGGATSGGGVTAATTIAGGAAVGSPNVAAPASKDQTAPIDPARPAATRQTTAASSVEGGGGGGAEGLRRADSQKRTKFDDEKLEEARRDAEREKERRGRSGTKASTLWGSVRRSRSAVEGTTTSGSGTKTPPDRHVLKKRNSKSDVEKVER